MSTEQIIPSGTTTDKIETVVADVVQTTSNISNVVKSTNSIATKAMVIIICAIIFLGFLKFKGCLPSINLPGIKIGPTVINNPDTTKPIIQTSTHVTYTPKPSKQNPYPTPVIIPKPLEGTVTIADGKIVVQNSGLVIVPKIGLVYVVNKDFELVAGIRFLFAGDFGLEAMVNDQRLFLGIDARDPIFNLATTSLGVTTPYADFNAPGIYLGEQLTLAQF